MQWLKENNCPFNESTFECAARNGDIEIMHWLLGNNFPLSSKCYSSAIQNDRGFLSQLQILDWLKEKSCPRGDSVLYLPAGQYIIKRYVREWFHQNQFTLKE